MGTDTRPFWRLSAIQVSNWGTYDGTHAPIRIDERATLLVGKSGSGKSTLLDAYTLLFNDNDAALNEASNSGNTSTRRSPITYTRGQTGAEPADRTGQGGHELAGGNGFDLRDRTLRGHDPETGRAIDSASGIAAVFSSTDGQDMTVMRLFYVPAHARVMSECTTRFGHAMRRIDLEEVMEFATEKFQHLKHRVPGWVAASGPGDLRQAAFRRFGVTATDTKPILDLMRKVQSSKPQPSINDLYQSMLDPRPDTYGQADAILRAHGDLRAVRAQMLDAEKQITRLSPIEGYHARREEARSTLAAADVLGVQTEGPSLLTAWLADRGLGIYDALEERATSSVDVLRRQLDSAEAAVQAADAGAERAYRAFQNAGGGRTELLERDHEDARTRLKTVQATCDSLKGTLDDADLPMPNSADDFAAAQRTAREFLTTYDRLKISIDDATARAYREQGKANDALLEAEEALASAQSSKSNIPRAYLKARDAYVEASGLSEDRMPFFGQLIDVREGHEQWRTAINAVLGGQAKNLVIDSSDRAHLQRTLDSLRQDVRVNRDVAADIPYVDTSDPSTLAGRVVVDESSPFAGWVRQRVDQLAHHECVETGDQLGDGTVARVALSGQVTLRHRDTHGGNRNNVIGFSNEARVEELQTHIDMLRTALAEADEAAGRVSAEKDRLLAQRAAHQRILVLTWPQLDLASAEEAEKTAQAALDATHDPGSLLGQARQAYEDATRARKAAEQAAANVRADINAAQKLVDDLIAKKETEYKTYDPELFARLTEEQHVFLDDRLATIGGIDTDTTDHTEVVARWKSVKAEIRRSLQQDLDTARRDYDAAGTSVREVMASYDLDWPDTTGERLPEPDREYDTYLGILNGLRDNDLPAARDRWEKKISEDATRGLGLLRRAYSDYTATVRETVANLNQVLMGIEFRDGAKRIRLDVHDRTRANASVFDFHAEPASLTERAASIDPSADLRAQREALFIALDKTLSRIDPDSPERDNLLNVNRHLVFRATVIDATDPSVEYDVIDALTGTHSGGESQQISAIIAGAALRYRMNDGGEAPRFTPIVLDEAFIKADAEFTEQGIKAWRALGFQLIVGAPEEKTESLMRTIPAMRIVTKESGQHTSQVYEVDRVSRGKR